MTHRPDTPGAASAARDGTAGPAGPHPPEARRPGAVPAAARPEPAIDPAPARPSSASGPRTALGSVADAVRGNWVDSWAPAAARPYLRLSRADRPIGTWLLLIPCWWGLALAVLAGAPRPGDLWIGAGCAMGAWLMRGAGCTWNDVTDRRIDAAVARTRSRPIPSGQVSVRGALAWMAAQALAAFVILLTFHPLAVALGVGSLALVAIYPFAKRFTWWPQVFLGLAFNWGALLAWAAHAGSLSAAPLVLYAAGVAWTLHYDTIYAHQDVEDDALIGVRSTARLFGDASRRWLRRIRGRHGGAAGARGGAGRVRLPGRDGPAAARAGAAGAARHGRAHGVAAAQARRRRSGLLPGGVPREPRRRADRRGRLRAGGARCGALSTVVAGAPRLRPAGGLPRVRRPSRIARGPP